MPVPEVKPEELSLVKPPLKLNAGLLVVVQMPPELMVTAPVKVLVPVALLSFKVPVIEVAPVTERLRVESCNVPAVIVRTLSTVVLPPSVVVLALLMVKLL